MEARQTSGQNCDLCGLGLSIAHERGEKATMKNLDYYMSLPYEIKVQELTEDDGGGIMLSIPLLGEMAVCAYGDTYTEAMSLLERVKRDYFGMWLEAGVEIPEPDPEHWLQSANVYVRELGLVGV